MPRSSPRFAGEILGLRSDGPAEWRLQMTRAPSMASVQILLRKGPESSRPGQAVLAACIAVAFVAAALFFGYQAFLVSYAPRSRGSLGRVLPRPGNRAPAGWACGVSVSETPITGCHVMLASP